jgi:hypothetical protein
MENLESGKKDYFAKLKADISKNSAAMAEEREKTGQSRLACFGSRMQVVSADTEIIEILGQLSQEQTAELKNKFVKLKERYFELKHRKSADVSEEEKKELMRLMDSLC